MTTDVHYGGIYLYLFYINWVWITQFIGGKNILSLHNSICKTWFYKAD